MKSRNPTVALFALLVGLSLALPAVAIAQPIEPDYVEAIIFPGGEHDVVKSVTTPEIPPTVEVCLLEDETGSFTDDIDNLQGGTTASDIYDAVVAASPGAKFAVAGFRDYPISPYGSPGDWVYRLLSGMSPAKAAWLGGIAGLSASGGNDGPEAQYDAIVAAAGAGYGDQGPCGFSSDPNVTKVLLVATDAPFHTPDGTHVNDAASTLTALGDIIVIGLKAPGASTELDYLASQTGGSVQALSSDGANIASAIITGLENLPIDVAMTSTCTWPIGTVFSEPQTVTSGDVAFFSEEITVAPDAPGGMYYCYDFAVFDGEVQYGFYELKLIKVPEGFLTGGGQIGKDKKAGMNFGGNVGYLEDFSIVGQWQFHDRSYNDGEGVKVHSTSIDFLQFWVDGLEGPAPPDANANMAHFGGTARVKVGNDRWIDGCYFGVYAEDRGEPARKGDLPDLISMYAFCDGLFDFDWGELDAGNLQIHSGVKD